VQAVARGRPGGDRHRPEPDLVVRRVAVEAVAGDRDVLTHLGPRRLHLVDLRRREEEELHEPPGDEQRDEPGGAEAEELHVHVGHAQRAALAACRTPGLPGGPGRAARGLGQRFRRRRRQRRRVRDRAFGDAQPHLGRRRRDLAARHNELDRVPVDEGRRLDRLAVDPGALAAPVVDHRDAEVVPDDLDVCELDLRVIEPQVGEASRADDHGQARVQLDVVAVHRPAHDQDRWLIRHPVGHPGPSRGDARARRGDDSTRDSAGRLPVS